MKFGTHRVKFTFGTVPRAERKMDARVVRTEAQRPIGVSAMQTSNFTLLVMTI